MHPIATAPRWNRLVILWATEHRAGDLHDLSILDQAASSSASRSRVGGPRPWCVMGGVFFLRYRRKSSSFSVLRWRAMPAVLTFRSWGFSNATSFDSSVWQTEKA